MYEVGAVQIHWIAYNNTYVSILQPSVLSTSNQSTSQLLQPSPLPICFLWLLSFCCFFVFFFGAKYIFFGISLFEQSDGRNEENDQKKNR